MPNCCAEHAGRDILNRANMGAQRVIHVVNDAGLNNDGRPLKGFFCRLKEELERPAFDFVLQSARRCEEHSGMPVVAAGMNAAGLPVNDKGERIHIGAKHENRPRFRAADDADNAR